ncbi:hypothetical protein ACVIIW_006218 [Bradyrhizobium sp. USDA 4449]
MSENPDWAAAGRGQRPLFCRGLQLLKDRKVIFYNEIGTYIRLNGSEDLLEKIATPTFGWG